MNKLFDRAIVIGDIHFGEKGNEKRHNEDCLKFIDWMISEAKLNNADRIIFLGDWNHQRNSLRVDTLNYSRLGLKKLNECGIPVIFLIGNHDLFYKDSRDISSIDSYGFDNIQFIDDITKIDNVLFCPWLLNKEQKEIKKELKNVSYVFGHFEIPHFLMNSQVEYKGEKQLVIEDFDDIEYWAFSGHFHKRQCRGKVFYIGNCFPHNFNDVWDDDRGIMILDWGKNPTFKSFPNAPKFRDMKLSEFLEDMTNYVDENTFIKITPDIQLTYEEYSIITEVIKNNFHPRKVEIRSTNIFSEIDNETKLDSFKSIDEIVSDGIDTLDSNTIDKEKLKKIYFSLEV